MGREIGEDGFICYNETGSWFGESRLDALMLLKELKIGSITILYIDKAIGSQILQKIAR